jgi:uracil-DNA glycosylase
MKMLAIKYHKSWSGFLTTDILALLDNIESQIGEDYTPDKENILRFLHMDVKNIKVVILGQDPYHSVYGNNFKVANGRAFEPANLNNWNDKFRQVSLKNIIRLIYKNVNEIENYQDIYKYNEIIKEIDYGKFEIKAPHQFFDSLEKQGVLLINTAFTTKLHQANAHRKLWHPFTIELIKFLNRKDIYWFLWGKNSLEYQDFIEGIKIISNHPMMCSQKYENDFLKSSCFKDTKDIINWLG